MIKTAENLIKVMRMEKNDASIKTIFFGCGGSTYCHLMKHETILAEGKGHDYETAFAEAYANLTGTADKPRTEVRRVDDAPSDEGAKATEAHPSASSKRRRGRPRKAEVTPHSDMEADVHQ